MSRSEADGIEEDFTPTLDAAKVIIKDYFEQHHSEIIDYVDLVRALEFPLSLIVDACEALEREGRIAGVDQRS
ncbi:MAG: hypothetical protein AB9873_18410 [Syntrophobacteraceae bacterium]